MKNHHLKAEDKIITPQNIDKLLKDAIRALERASTMPLFWVDNEHFYRSGVARAWGFWCTDKELERAKCRKGGFIKKACGVDLYLTQWLPTSIYGLPVVGNTQNKTLD